MSSDQLGRTPAVSIDEAAANPFEEQDPRPCPFFPSFAPAATVGAPPLSPFSSPSNAVISSPWDLDRSHPLSVASPDRCVATVTKRGGRILSLAVSGGGFLYAGTESKAIRVWRDPGFFDISQLRSSSGDVNALLVSSGEGLIFSAHADCKIRVWNSSPVHFRKGTLPSAMECLIKLCWSQPKKTLMKITSSHSYSLLSGVDHRPRHGGTITSLTYDPAAKLLYSASSDSTFKVWSIGEMRCVETVQAHDGSVNALAVVVPDTVVFTCSDDGKVKAWRRSPGKRCSHALLSQMDTHGTPVKSLVAAREAGGVEELFVLYAGCSDGSVRYWKKGGSTGQLAYLGYLRGHGQAVLCLAAAGRTVVTGSEDASVRVWRRSVEGLATHVCVAVLCGHMGPVKAVAMGVESEQAYLVYSGSLDGSVKQWRIARDQQRR